jgi:hypothetical protein
MLARRSWLVVAVACVCVGFGVAAVKAPPASADAGSWVAEKLVSGAGSGAGDAALGGLMAHAGLDPTTEALKEISAHLTQLSNQIKDLQATSDRTLRAVLDASLIGRYDVLEVSNVTKLQEDFACYVDAKKEKDRREACRARFKSLANAQHLATAAGKYNDLLANPHTTIVESYAKTLAVGTDDPFYTPQDQDRVGRFYDYLDDLQVAATTLSIEARTLVATEEGPEKLSTAEAVNKLEGESLEAHRAAQRVRNPLEKIPGTLETNLALWIDTTTQRGQRDFWSAVHARWDGTRLWVLPSKPQLLSMVKGRGDKTVKRYLVVDADMGEALAGVPESGPTGQLWTSTPAYCNFGELEGPQCRDAVSTNNAYVRAQPAPHDSTEPRFYSFLVTPMNDKERDRYRFLLK